jgi:uncharacterized protein YecT (DUF1311 family)
MKAWLVSVGAAVACAAAAGIAHGGTSGETQADINASAGAQMKSAEKAMAEALDRLMQNPDQQAVGKLRKAQAAWEAYRDAQIEALWPSRQPPLSAGTVFPACVAFARATLTEARTKELKQMSAGEVGDTCAPEWSE